MNQQIIVSVIINITEIEETTGEVIGRFSPVEGKRASKMGEVLIAFRKIDIHDPIGLGVNRFREALLGIHQIQGSRPTGQRRTNRQNGSTVCILIIRKAQAGSKA